ncbi:hypothetical protein ACS0PU_003824 [Formica fusca]
MRLSPLAFQGRISFSYDRIIQQPRARSLFLVFPSPLAFPFFSGATARSRRGAAIYVNILDNKSRRVIYEVFPSSLSREYPRTAFGTPYSLKINNADGEIGALTRLL